MNNIGDKCDHGRSWEEECQKCDATWLEEVTIPNTKRSLQRMVNFCDKYPGIIERSSVATMRDLYVLIGMLLEKTGP